MNDDVCVLPSLDIDECAVLASPCGKQAICENTVPGYNCRCPQGYAGQPTPDVACEQVMKDFPIFFRFLFTHQNTSRSFFVV